MIINISEFDMFIFLSKISYLSHTLNKISSSNLVDK